MSEQDAMDIALSKLLRNLDLDKPCVSEDYERMVWQTVRCGHGVVFTSCQTCNPPKTGFINYMGGTAGW